MVHSTPGDYRPVSKAQGTEEILALRPGLIDFLSSSGGGAGHELVAILEQWGNLKRSVSALGPAIAALETPTSPPLASAIQATENLWTAIEDRWGLLRSSEVATLLGSRSGTRNLASSLRQKNEIIGVKRRSAFVYPGFQFDRKAATVRKIIPALLAAARSAGVDDEYLVYWLCSPSTYFDDDQPVVHLSTDPNFVEKFVQSETVTW